MGICKTVRLNVKGYRTYLNEKIRIYQNDSFKLRFIIEYCGIQTEQILKNKGLNISNLTATLFIETPNEIDTLEQAEVVSDMIEFNLTNKYTQHIGTSRMQIQLKDDDDCIYTLPEFTFEVKKNIYDATEIQNVTLIDEEDNNVIDEYDNRILVEHSVSLVEGYKQIKDFALKSEVVGTEDLLIQDNGVTKRIKTGSIKGTQDLTSYYTKEEINSKLSAKSNTTHNHDTVYASKNTEHIHTNKTTLDKITDGKLTEWDNKSEFDGDYTTLKNKPAIPSLEGYASETFVTTKIAEAQLDGGNVDLSGYATKEDLNFKVDTIPDKGLSTNDFTNEEKLKLETLNNYTHPETHKATIIVQDTTHRFVSDTEKMNWNNKSEFDGNYNSLINKPHIPNVEGLASELFVTEKIAEAQIGGGDEVDLSKYVTKDELDLKVDKVPNKGLTTNDFTNEEKSKLASLNNYTHPDIHEATIIAQDETHRFVTDNEKASWNNKSNFDGDYNSLTNKPTLLKGDKGDKGDRGEQGLKGDKGEQGIVDYSNIYNKQEVDNKISEAIDLSEYYTKEESDIKLDSKANANHNHDDTYATKSSEHIHANKTILDEITDEKMMSWDNKSDFNGSYDALTNKPTLLKGDKGDVGATPNLTIGTVETLLPSQPVSVTITGTEVNPILNFGIPKGESGSGSNGEYPRLLGELLQTANDVIKINDLNFETGIMIYESGASYGINSSISVLTVFKVDILNLTTIPYEIKNPISNYKLKFLSENTCILLADNVEITSYDHTKVDIDYSSFWFEVGKGLKITDINLPLNRLKFDVVGIRDRYGWTSHAVSTTDGQVFDRRATHGGVDGRQMMLYHMSYTFSQAGGDFILWKYSSSSKILNSARTGFNAPTGVVGSDIVAGSDDELIVDSVSTTGVSNGSFIQVYDTGGLL